MQKESLTEGKPSDRKTVKGITETRRDGQIEEQIEEIMVGRKGGQNEKRSDGKMDRWKKGWPT